MTEDQLNNSDISNQETDKISRVTQEMLDAFAEPKQNKNSAEDNESEKLVDEYEQLSNEDEETTIAEGEQNSNTDEEKTVVEFIEDETEITKKPKKKRKPFFGLKVILGLILAFMLIVAVFGIWNRWFRYDDKSQLISNWQISGTNTVIVIDGKKIHLDKDAVLEYEVDDFAKLINYKIGDKSGTSHYRFSWDRNQLALIENCGNDAVSTICSDLGWFWDFMTCSMAKIDLSPAYTKNNKDEVDTHNTGIEDIISNGHTSSMLLDKISTKRPENNL